MPTHTYTSHIETHTQDYKILIFVVAFILFFQVSAQTHLLNFFMCEMRWIWELNYAVFPSEKSPSMLDGNKAAKTRTNYGIE